MVLCFLVFLFFFCELLIFLGTSSERIWIPKLKLWSSREKVSLLIPVSWGHILGVTLTLIPGFMFFQLYWVAQIWSSGEVFPSCPALSVMISFLAVEVSHVEVLLGSQLLARHRSPVLPWYSPVFGAQTQTYGLQGLEETPGVESCLSTWFFPKVSALISSVISPNPFLLCWLSNLF